MHIFFSMATHGAIFLPVKIPNTMRNSEPQVRLLGRLWLNICDKLSNQQLIVLSNMRTSISRIWKSYCSSLPQMAIYSQDQYVFLSFTEIFARLDNFNGRNKYMYFGIKFNINYYNNFVFSKLISVISIRIRYVSNYCFLNNNKSHSDKENS